MIITFLIYRNFDLLYARIITSTGQAEDLYRMSSGRTMIWSSALEKIFDSPINLFFGMGWNTFKQYFTSAPHNIYLNYFFELGIIGVGLILYVFFKIFKLSTNALLFSSQYENLILTCFLFGYFAMLSSVFFVDLYQPWIFIWSYIGLVTRLALEIFDTNVRKPVKNEIIKD